MDFVKNQLIKFSIKTKVIVRSIFFSYTLSQFVYLSKIRIRSSNWLCGLVVKQASHATILLPLNTRSWVQTPPYAHFFFAFFYLFLCIVLDLVLYKSTYLSTSFSERFLCTALQYLLWWYSLKLRKISAFYNYNSACCAVWRP